MRSNSSFVISPLAYLFFRISMADSDSRLVPQKPCLFYWTKNVSFPGATIKTDPNPKPAKIIRREWCAHPKSRHPRQILGPNVPCDGDLEKCVIPD